mgnify:CR=1 FL=1
MEFDLSIVLTAAGATASAALISGLIEGLKRATVSLGIAARLVDGYEATWAFILSGALAGYAYLATVAVPDPANAFGVLLAWLGIARLAMATHDVVTTRSLMTPGLTRAG